MGTASSLASFRLIDKTLQGLCQKSPPAVLSKNYILYQHVIKKAAGFSMQGHLQINALGGKLIRDDNCGLISN
jgi:hypothetical protein